MCRGCVHQGLGHTMEQGPPGWRSQVGRCTCKQIFTAQGAMCFNRGMYMAMWTLNEKDPTQGKVSQGLKERLGYNQENGSEEGRACF